MQPQCLCESAFDLLSRAFLGHSHVGSKDDCDAMLQLAAVNNVKP